MDGILDPAEQRAAIADLAAKSRRVIDVASQVVKAIEEDKEWEPADKRAQIAAVTAAYSSILSAGRTLRELADFIERTVTKTGLHLPLSYDPDLGNDSDIEVITEERPASVEIREPSTSPFQSPDEDSSSSTKDKKRGKKTKKDKGEVKEGKSAFSAPGMAASRATMESSSDSDDDLFTHHIPSSSNGVKSGGQKGKGKGRRDGEAGKESGSSSDDEGLKALEAAGRLRFKINASTGKVTPSPSKDEESKSDRPKSSSKKGVGEVRKRIEEGVGKRGSGVEEVEVGGVEESPEETLDEDESLPPIPRESSGEESPLEADDEDLEESVFSSTRYLIFCIDMMEVKRRGRENKKREPDSPPDVVELDSDGDEEQMPKGKRKSLKLPGMVKIDDPDASSDEEEGGRVKEDQPKKKRRKLAIDSEDDDFSAGMSSDEEEEDAAPSSEDIDKPAPAPKRSRGRPKKSEAEGGKKKRRVRTADSEDSDVEEVSDGERKAKKLTEEGSPTKRKGAKKLISDEKLEKTTKDAGKAEKDRWKRLEEKQKRFNGLVINDAGTEGPCFKEVVLDKDPDSDKFEALVEIESCLVKPMKKHQGEGIQFIFNSTMESVDQYKKGDRGGGCILAHCMGLGKTYQCVVFLYTIMTNDIFARGDGEGEAIRCTLVLAPVNAMLTWQREFTTWLKKANSNINHWVLQGTNLRERVDVLRMWREEGGVLITGYPLLRVLRQAVEKPKSSKGLSKKAAEILGRSVDECLFNPGPDIVVCDEGHMLKNDKAKITQVVEKIRTRRRICLTGTPIQNHLEEYFTMVNFVKPGLLGTKKEFKNRFENPIKAGQFLDSSKSAVRMMKQRSFCLNKELSKVVMRRDHIELVQYLPKKQEYIVYVRLTPRQSALYSKFINTAVGDTDAESLKSRKILPDFHQFSRIWLHPYALIQHQREDEARRDRLELLEEEAEFVVEEDEEEDAVMTDSDEEKKKKKKGKKRWDPDSDEEEEEVVQPTRRRTRGNPGDSPDQRSETPEDIRGWWGDMVKEEDQFEVRISSKLDLLFSIMKKCEEAGDKLLVFSQSLMSLNIIERFLEYYQDTNTWFDDEHEVTACPAGARWGWLLGKDYYRLDGSVNVDNRKKMQVDFNNPINPRARLFLISTRAGSLGIDLIGANRVIVFDCCWNPSHDTQSIFRVFRFGQKKPCYIYRFVTEGSMEEVIFRRQVTKQSVQLRVCDDLTIQRHFQQNDVEELYQFNPSPIPEGDQRSQHIRSFKMPEDVMLRDLILDKGEWIGRIDEHDSLLEHKEAEALSTDEQKEAWNEYEYERVRGVPRARAMAFNEPTWFTLAKPLITIPCGDECAILFRDVCTRWLAYGQQYLERIPVEARSGVSDMSMQFYVFIQADMTSGGILNAYKKMREFVITIITAVEAATNPAVTQSQVEELLKQACGEWRIPPNSPFLPPSVEGRMGVDFEPSASAPVLGAATSEMRDAAAMAALNQSIGHRGALPSSSRQHANTPPAPPARKETVHVAAKK